MTTRFPPIAEPDMTEAQRRLADEVASRSGPYFAYLRSPDLWRAMQAPRAHFRRQTNLGKADQELAILVTARAWKSQSAFSSHARLAREAGLPEEVIRAVAMDEAPALTEPQAAIYGFCRALVGTGRVTDEQFEAVRRHFTEQGVVDLTGIVGYYGFVSMLLNLDGQTADDALPF